MLLAILNDTHSGSRNASEIFLKYHARFYSEIFFPYCEKNGIKQILHLGDFYDHRKYINFKALNHNRRTFLEPLRDLGMSMDIIPGNHDVYHKDSNDLCSLKELLGYFVENINIVMKPRVMDYSGCKIALLPWINQTNLEESINFVKECPASILGAHLELAGFEIMRGQIAEHGMDAGLFSKFETVLSGHYHAKSEKGNIHYLGSQYEMFWSDAEDPKYFHVFDTDTRILTPVRNPLTIYSKVTYDDRNPMEIDLDKLKDNFVKIIVTNKSDLVKFDQFVDRVQSVGVHEIKIVETYEEFSGENVADNEDEDGSDLGSDTGIIIDTYVDSVETVLDKTVIKNKMRELYVEAQQLEQP